MMLRNILTCLLTMVICCAGSTGIRAADSAPEADVPDASQESGAYCGVYCVYAALNCYGKKIEFPTLLQTKYIGDMSGSSIHELSAAVRDNGLHALPMTGLSRANLVAAQTPIILHVSTPDTPGFFGHWMLFLGMEDGQAKIVDAPHKPELVPVADLLARWDGVGLYVSDTPLSPRMLKFESLATGENVVTVMALCVLIGLLQRIARRHRESGLALRPYWVTTSAVLAAAGVLAAAWHSLSQDGYARNQVAIRSVIQQHRPSFLPKLGVPEMKKVLSDEKVVIVDARYPRDFEAGHLPGAINVPVFTTAVERRKLLSHVPKDARIVVYCQSAGCQFDETLGSALVAEGLENVSLFPGGFAQWDQKQDPAEKQASTVEKEQQP